MNRLLDNNSQILHTHSTSSTEYNHKTSALAAVLLQTPSFYSLAATGILLLISILLLVFRYNPSLQSISIFQRLCLILLFTIAIGVHGIIHLGLEYVYGYNPMNYLLR